MLQLNYYAMKAVVPNGVFVLCGKVWRLLWYAAMVAAVTGMVEVDLHEEQPSTGISRQRSLQQLFDPFGE